MNTHGFQWAIMLTLSFSLIKIAQASEFITFSVQDIKLQECLTKLADENHWKQIQDVKRIECHSQNISSLQGLEKFINVEHLSLYNNNLTLIDINLRKFNQLKTLNLARNNIHHLSVSDLPTLHAIYVFDNSMKSLKLNNLLNLNVLKANNNKIEDFVYSNTPKLQKVYIFNNQLETVNIYDLPSLHYMDCRQNPMPDSLYDEMDQQDEVSFLHDGNAEDW